MPSPSSIKQQLSAHYDVMKNIHMRDLFKHDEHRGKEYTLSFSDIEIDYSKNILSEETLELLFNYAKECKVDKSIKSMFAGEKINLTEDRAVLHTALRTPSSRQIKLDGIDIVENVHIELDKIKHFVEKIYTKEHTGWTNKPIDTFVNIGIGGSDLGPKLVVDALEDYRLGNTRSFFISNIDYEQIASLQKKIDPETTLFIISSKSFSTIETLTNAETLKLWMLKIGCTDVSKHFIAVSNNIDATNEFGINPENVFELWDWVGGRFSLWSAIGLPIALAIGYKNFSDLLAGAHNLDEHFLNTPLEENIPVTLALIDYWYSNFFEAQTHAFLPYDESLNLFPDYLAQLLMESNGKSTNINGHVINDKTMPVCWGSTGTNSQHSFFQLLHQGTQMVPVDFIATLVKKGNKKHHALLLANCFAQSQAMMEGENNTNPHRYVAGNKPSTTILCSELTPGVLGSLIALYEHRTFVQGLLWEINSFDQWGVELGKKLATKIYSKMEGNIRTESMDSSTENLITLYNKAQP